MFPVLFTCSWKDTSPILWGNFHKSTPSKLVYMCAKKACGGSVKARCWFLRRPPAARVRLFEAAAKAYGLRSLRRWNFRVAIFTISNDGQVRYPTPSFQVNFQFKDHRRCIGHNENILKLHKCRKVWGVLGSCWAWCRLDLGLEQHFGDFPAAYTLKRQLPGEDPNNTPPCVASAGASQ